MQAPVAILRWDCFVSVMCIYTKNMQSFPRQQCVACGGGRLRSFTAPDNTRPSERHFAYAECDDCHTTFLDESIENLAATYPEGYYSLQSAQLGGRYRAANAILRSLLAVGLPNRFFVRAFPRLSPYYFLNAYGIKRDATIIDVGSGTGRFVHRLGELGYRNASGIDPYIHRDIKFANGTHVARQSLADVNVSPDVFFFNHSLEHIADPIACLCDAAGKLASGGYIVVRIPLAGSFAHAVFGTTWWQFDAPRHVTLFSAAAFQTVAENMGLGLQEIVFDGAGHSLATSMAIKAGACGRDPATSRGLAAAIQRLQPGFAKAAREFNQCGLGDQAMFVLRPSTSVAAT